uniref:Uncharacterized protein n=1 Tax=Romanomermis culicivorax TaxID=13658 RepID=A0A915IM77_ROMCU
MPLLSFMPCLTTGIIGSQTVDAKCSPSMMLKMTTRILKYSKEEYIFKIMNYSIPLVRYLDCICCT